MERPKTIIRSLPPTPDKTADDCTFAMIQTSIVSEVHASRRMADSDWADIRDFHHAYPSTQTRLDS
jgi:hypothetical protein